MWGGEKVEKLGFLPHGVAKFVLIQDIPPTPPRQKKRRAREAEMRLSRQGSDNLVD